MMRSWRCARRVGPVRPTPKRKRKWICLAQNRGDRKGLAARGLAINRHPSGVAAALFLTQTPGPPQKEFGNCWKAGRSESVERTDQGGRPYDDRPGCFALIEKKNVPGI